MIGRRCVGKAGHGRDPGPDQRMRCPGQRGTRGADIVDDHDHRGARSALEDPVVWDRVERDLAALGPTAPLLRVGPSDQKTQVAQPREATQFSRQQPRVIEPAPTFTVGRGRNPGEDDIGRRVEMDGHGRSHVADEGVASTGLAGEHHTAWPGAVREYRPGGNETRRDRECRCAGETGHTTCARTAGGGTTARAGDREQEIEHRPIVTEGV